MIYQFCLWIIFLIIIALSMSDLWAFTDKGAHSIMTDYFYVFIVHLIIIVICAIGISVVGLELFKK